MVISFTGLLGKVRRVSNIHAARTCFEGYSLSVKDIPISADFSFKFTPSLTTLFRFSALTFNAHHIHLDKDYATKVEAYPGSPFFVFINSVHDILLYQNDLYMVRSPR